MARAFFISDTYLKDNSPLSGNVDIEELYPFAQVAEDTHIQETLGTKLYERLIDGVTNNNLTANEITLLKKVRSLLVWLVCYEALPFIAIKIRNIGLVKQAGENLESATREDTSYLRKIIKDKADHYMIMLQKYLCQNSSLFEDYCCGDWNCSELMPNTHVSNSSDLAIERNENDIDTDFARKWFKNQ